MTLDKLNEKDAIDAIQKPIDITKSTLRFKPALVKYIAASSSGYPFFIQFIAKEVFDAWIGKIKVGEAPLAPVTEIMAKLDQDFFAPRWGRATDRQQEFMQVIATLQNSE
jgi:hypothetical protein